MRSTTGPQAGQGFVTMTPRSLAGRLIERVVASTACCGPGSEPAACDASAGATRSARKMSAELRMMELQKSNTGVECRSVRRIQHRDDQEQTLQVGRHRGGIARAHRLAEALDGEMLGRDLVEAEAGRRAGAGGRDEERIEIVRVRSIRHDIRYRDGRRSRIEGSQRQAALDAGLRNLEGAPAEL